MNLKQYLRGTGGTHKKYISEVKLDGMRKFSLRMNYPGSSSTSQLGQ